MTFFKVDILMLIYFILSVTFNNTLVKSFVVSIILLSPPPTLDSPLINGIFFDFFGFNFFNASIFASGAEGFDAYSVSNIYLFSIDLANSSICSLNSSSLIFLSIITSNFCSISGFLFLFLFLLIIADNSMNNSFEFTLINLFSSLMFTPIAFKNISGVLLTSDIYASIRFILFVSIVVNDVTLLISMSFMKL